MIIGVSTFVHGWYVDYIPIYIYSIIKSYPLYKPRVFIQNTLDKNIIESLNLIPSNFDIIENKFNDKINKDPSKKPYYLRWLLSESDFHGLDCVFICDVDYIMLKEDPPMHEQRLLICKNINQPYANFLRKKSNNYPERISGWHFIKVKEYYEKTKIVIEDIINDKNFDISNYPSYCYNNGFGEKQWGQESLLYKIIKLSFDLDDESIREPINKFPYHHGLHLGPFRTNIPYKFIKGDKKSIEHIGINSKYIKMVKEINEIFNDNIMIKLIEKIKNEKVKNTINSARKFFNKKVIFL